MTTMRRGIVNKDEQHTRVYYHWFGEQKEEEETDFNYLWSTTEDIWTDFVFGINGYSMKYVYKSLYKVQIISLVHVVCICSSEERIASTK